MTPSKHTLLLSLFLLSLIACGVALGIFMRFQFDSPEGLDQERLGQLGDFLGGVLNPAFGFLTVTLLIFTSFIQRKELHNSEKLVQSSASEARRTQAEDALAALFMEQEAIFRRELHNPFSDGEGYSTRTLHEALIKDMARKNKLLSNYIRTHNRTEDFPRDLSQRLLLLASNARLASRLSAEIIKLSDSIVTQEFWLHKFTIESAKCLRCGAINQEEHNELTNNLINSLPVELKSELTKQYVITLTG